MAEGLGVSGEKLLKERERLATLSLWAIPGIGPKGFGAIVELFRGNLTEVLSLEPSEWIGALNFTAPVRQMLSQVKKMGDLGECVMDRARKAEVGIAFPGDAAFPSKLSQIPDPPPVLFSEERPAHLAGGLRWWEAATRIKASTRSRRISPRGSPRAASESSRGLQLESITSVTWAHSRLELRRGRSSAQRWTSLTLRRRNCSRRY